MEKPANNNMNSNTVGSTFPDCPESPSNQQPSPYERSDRISNYHRTNHIIGTIQSEDLRAGARVATNRNHSERQREGSSQQLSSTTASTTSSASQISNRSISNNGSIPQEQHYPSELTQQNLFLLSQDATRNLLLQQLVEVAASVRNVPLAPSLNPIDFAQMNSMMQLHHEMPGYQPRVSTIPFLPSLIDPFLRSTYSAAAMIEAQPDLQQLIHPIHNNTNNWTLRQSTPWLQDCYESAQLQSSMLLQENLTNQRDASFWRRNLEAHLLSSLVQDSRNQNTTTPTPTLPPEKMIPRTLAQPEDRFTLSEFQVLLRQNIEVFQATPEEAGTHLRGRNIPIYVDQVGIRCSHCKNVPLPRRLKGSMYFPSHTLRIYQAAQNMATSHIQCGRCPEMPALVKERFQALVSTKSISGGAGRAYWAQSAATHLGLVDTAMGIRYSAPATVH